MQVPNGHGIWSWHDQILNHFSQIPASFNPISALTLISPSISIAPGRLNGSCNGTLGGNPLNVDLLSVVQAAGRRIGSIKLASSAGIALDRLLSSVTSSIRSDYGFSVPPAPTSGHDNSSSAPTSAELLIDQQYGLRMVNLSLSGSSQFGLADLASRVGFRWQSSTEGSDVLSFSSPRLYYVMKKLDAPGLEWNGKPFAAPELGVAASVNLPALGLTGVDGVLRVQANGKLSIQVKSLLHNCSLLLMFKLRCIALDFSNSEAIKH
jgi:hypothetical protein